MNLFDNILASRGLQGRERDAFLSPDYGMRHNPYLLPDMGGAVDRLIDAKNKSQKITIYGDYDIDGITATTLLLDAFKSFGFVNVDVYVPNRFVEGYGLTIDAVEKIAKTGTELIVTVDCGSLSEKEIIRAKQLGLDVIVTDHHNVAPVQPPAVAVINPKRWLMEYPDEYDNYILKSNSKFREKIYPFLDLAGVGVAFKLVQALQQKDPSLSEGQEKWLLDLVALGTVCDVVNLTDENRTNVYWGIEVLKKTRRPGIRALMEVCGVTPENISARSLGFALGPRMNAAGRLETAQHSLDLLMSKEEPDAALLAQKLDVMNTTRREEQDRIFSEADKQAQYFLNDNVLVLSSENWSHGIIGIVAAKLLEKYKKPTFVLEEMGNESKGSARSFGDFSAADAIRASDDIIIKGGGHKFAAGVTMPTERIVDFRKRVNDFYRTKKLFSQDALLLAKEDVIAPLLCVDEELINDIATMEPFGNGNPEPVLCTQNLRVTSLRKMGINNQHVKLGLCDVDGRRMYMLAFNAPDHFFVEINTRVTVWYQPIINEWQGRRSIEGRLLRLERA